MLTNIILRNFEERDNKFVLEIIDGQIGRQYLEEIKKELNEIRNGSVRGFVADKYNRIIGYVSWRKKVEVAYLESIVVQESLQDSGVGKELLDKVISDVKQNSPDIYLLNVVTDSDAFKTIRFYLKNGFQTKGFVQDEFILGTSQIHLSLDLRK